MLDNLFFDCKYFSWVQYVLGVEYFLYCPHILKRNFWGKHFHFPDFFGTDAVFSRKLSLIHI